AFHRMLVDNPHSDSSLRAPRHSSRDNSRCPQCALGVGGSSALTDSFAIPSVAISPGVVALTRMAVHMSRELELTINEYEWPAILPKISSSPDCVGMSFRQLV